MKGNSSILEQYKNQSSLKICELTSPTQQQKEIIEGIGRVLFEALGFIPVISTLKTSFDVIQKSKFKYGRWKHRFEKSVFSYCDGKNIKNPYRTDTFSLSEQDQALILKRQFDYSQEQKQIVERLKKLKSDELCWTAAEYEESRESITSSLVYALFLDNYKNNLNEVDQAFENFMIIKNYLRELKYEPIHEDKNDNGADETQLEQTNLEQNDSSEAAEEPKLQSIQPLTAVEALNEHKAASIPNEILANALNTLEAVPETDNTKAFFNHIAETVLRTYEKSILELYYAAIAQIANIEQTELIQYICEDVQHAKELFETLANNQAFLRYRKNLKIGQDFDFVLKEFLDVHNKLNDLMKEQKTQYTIQPEFKGILSHFAQFNESQLSELSMLLDQNQHGMSYIKNLVEYDLASSVSDFDELKNTLISLSDKFQKIHQI